MKLFKEHQYLLIKRESRVVLGKHAINLWLLTLVLTATFLAISFSAGSMAYLDEKMNDPFTYWLNVYREEGSTNLSQVADGLENDSLKQRFMYDEVQTELASSLDFLGAENKYQLFKIQYYENMKSDLITKVLSEDNVISVKGKRYSIEPDSIHERSLGVIMTMDAIRRLGYSKDSIPAFVDCRVPARDADTLGFYVHDDYLRAPIPLLAVVRRLPMNKDVIASKYLYIQYSDNYDPEPFNLSKEHYARRLYFFVPNIVTNFESEALKCILVDSVHNGSTVKITENRIQERFRPWQNGCVKTVYPNGLPPIHVVNEIERGILKKFAQQGVKRIYDYDESMREIEGQSNIDNGLSIRFNKLDSIRSFEQFMKDRYQLQIEMTQVQSKENFNAVSTMANILTFALLLFSIASIVIFIVNMMQNYFQKVRRNLGTFKAFGISTRELTRTYIAIIVSIVLAALTISLVFTGFIELLLRMLGVMKEGTYSWLILWNANTLFAIIVILLFTVFSIFTVMKKILRRTPGDLIYDRFTYLIVALMVCVSVQGQSSADIQAYINKYKNIALEQERLYGIPASITLAQGILESGAGKSGLARNANNHFGIKTYGGWKGKAYAAWDDEKSKSKFRWYNSVEESYKDHSKFLIDNPGYNFLFNKSIYDYRGWANGLQHARYATSPTYAKALIGYIDTYRLYAINGGIKLRGGKKEIITRTITIEELVEQDFQMEEEEESEEEEEISTTIKRYGFISDINDVRCTFMYPGEDLAAISKKYDIPQKKILEYNETTCIKDLKEGDIVFLGKKKKKYVGAQDYYRVRKGETLYKVSQQFGIRLICLSKMNNLNILSELTEGQKLRLK